MFIRRPAHLWYLCIPMYLRVLPDAAIPPLMNAFALRFLTLVSVPFMFAACATSEESLDADELTVEESAQDLTARSAKYVGNYSDSRRPVVEFESLTLNSDGTFSALTHFQTVYPFSKMACLNGACTLPESGKFRVVRQSGKDVLVLDPSGPNNARRYTAAFTSQGLKLIRGAKTFTLKQDVDVCARVRCGGGTECQVQTDGSASCVPVLHPACAFTTCAPGNACVQDPNDASQATCVATCQLLDCMPGKTCVDTASGGVCR
jgi:hypothetical protein